MKSQLCQNSKALEINEIPPAFPADHISIRILNSACNPQDKGDFKTHSLYDPFVSVVCWGPLVSWVKGFPTGACCGRLFESGEVCSRYMIWFVCMGCRLGVHTNGPLKPAPCYFFPFTRAPTIALQPQQAPQGVLNRGLISAL